MKDEAAIKIKRSKALSMITASMAIIIQTYDLVMSAEILEDATKEYGKELVDSLMTELISSGFVEDLSTLPEDILHNRAMLNMAKALPPTWMKTRN